jgi:alanine-synthesizing transaminase
MFSSRVSADLTPNRLSRAVERCRADGTPFIDLTVSNPTASAFRYPPQLLLDEHNAQASLTYAPQPLGLPAARAAVAADYARRGLDVDPQRVVLTTGTSEAYSLLFKLLCDPGDEILIPRPSYPLFEHLAQLDAVRARFYDTDYHGAWTIDMPGVEQAITDRTRAMLVVSPNNPTGATLKLDELERLAAACGPRGIAIIADEVFADYPLDAGPSCQIARVAERRTGLAFSLGGLSKSVGLPQVKLGWIVVSGDDALVRAALERLELACDTYLSVATPVQLAAGTLLEKGSVVREQIQARVAANYRHARRAAEGTACTVLPAEGGWYAVLSVPTYQPEEDLVVELLEQHRVLAHPGYFFDFARESFLVVSLLAAERDFTDGFARITRHFDCRA